MSQNPAADLPEGFQWATDSPHIELHEPAMELCERFGCEYEVALAAVAAIPLEELKRDWRDYPGVQVVDPASGEVIAAAGECDQ